MKTNIKVLIGVLALAVIGAAVYFSKNELQKGATRRPVQRPDYEISSITVDPANPIEGENFKISVIVKNKSSTTAATVPSKTLLHLSGQPLPIATTQPLGPLATEDEVWQTTSTQRRLLIRSCADADRAIAESNERNNCRERTVDLLPPPLPPPPPPPPLCTEGQYNCESWTECSAEGSQTGTSCRRNDNTCMILPEPLTRACTPPPNLLTNTVIINTASPTAGNPVNFSVNINNTGSTTAPASTTTLTISGTSTSGVPYEVYRQNISTPELSAGNIARVYFEWPSAVEGSYHVRVCADSENGVPEITELDNCGSYRPITVAPAPPPLPRCAEGQYTCDSWTECSATGSQTGTSCRPSDNTCVILPEPLTRACTPPPPPMPDLVIDSATVEQDAISGAIIVRANIRNAGTTDAFINILQLAAMTIDSRGRMVNVISERTVYSNGNSGTSRFTLQAGTTLNVVFAYVYQNNWRRSGVNGIRLLIDSSVRYDESNETNNTIDIVIPAEFLAWTSLPNLQINSLDQPIITYNSPVIIAGRPLYFNPRVWNNDSTTAPASTTTLTINGTSTSSSLGEVYRQNVATPELAADQMSPVNFDWPSAIEGNFIANVCADSENIVVEQSEWDNCASRWFSVAPAPSE